MLIVENLSGCRDTVIKTVDIGVLPVAGFTFDTVCQGNATTFINQSTSNATSIILYTWDFGDGSSLSHLENPTHQYSVGGLFTVTLTIVNSNGCVSDTSRSVLVSPLPQAGFSYSSSGCLGVPVQYTDLSTTAPGSLSGIVKWVWDFGDGTSETILSPASPNVTHIFSGTALTHVVTLSVTTSDGCMGSAQQTVTLTPSPVAGFTFPQPPGTVHRPEHTGSGRKHRPVAVELRGSGLGDEQYVNPAAPGSCF
jgi:PKD repeat protein